MYNACLLGWCGVWESSHRSIINTGRATNDGICRLWVVLHFTWIALLQLLLLLLLCTITVHCFHIPCIMGFLWPHRATSPSCKWSECAHLYTLVCCRYSLRAFSLACSLSRCVHLFIKYLVAVIFFSSFFYSSSFHYFAYFHLCFLKIISLHYSVFDQYYYFSKQKKTNLICTHFVSASTVNRKYTTDNSYWIESTYKHTIVTVFEQKIKQISQIATINDFFFQ